jgi:hypothetical protein
MDVMNASSMPTLPSGRLSARALVPVAAVLIILLTPCLRTADASESSPPCLSAGKGEVGEAAILNAQKQVEKLQALWASGAYSGYNRRSGTSMTKSAVERQIKQQQKMLDDYRAKGDEAVAFSGAGSQSGRSIKKGIAGAEQRGDHAAAERGRKGLATWQTSVDRYIGSIEKRIAGLNDFLAELREKYDKEIDAIESTVGIDLDPATGLVPCEELTGLVGVAPPVEGADETPPRIKTLDEQMADCMTRDGDERDLCLANLALLHRSPEPCQAAPDGRCGEFVGKVVMGQCQADHPNEDVSTCEYTAAAWINSPSACKEASNLYGCLSAVAAERGDPQIIMNHIADPATRDLVLTTYAATTGDTGVLDLIEDNNQYDLAITFVALRLGVGEGQRLSATYCNRLRGGYDDEDVNRDVCRGAVGLNNWVVDQIRVAETEAEEERIISELMTLIERFDSGDLTLGEWLKERGLE